MASYNLGRVGFVVKGTHASTSTYKKLDVVISGANTYVAMKDVPAGTAITNTTYWQLFVPGAESVQTDKTLTQANKPADAKTVGDLLKVTTTLTTTDKTYGGAINELNSNIGNKASLTTTSKANIVSAVNEIDADIGDKNTLTTTAKTDIVAAINEVDSDIGDKTTLTTTAKTDLVSAVNEVDADIGDITTLTTTDKTDVVTAINEVDGDVGDLSLLTTTEKTNIVSSINQIDDRIGDMSSLTTTEKSKIVFAINELDEDVGDIDTAIAGADANVKDVATAIGAMTNMGSGAKSITETIGDLTTLTTEKKDSIVEAINQVDENMDEINSMLQILFDVNDDIIISTTEGKKLVGDGTIIDDEEYNIVFYKVQRGQILYIHVEKDTEAIFQFSSSKTTVDTTTLVGQPVTTSTNCSVKAPFGTEYIIMSQKKTNTQNYVSILGLNTTVQAVRSQVQNMLDWNTIKQIVRNGRASEQFSIGQQLTTLWTDRSISTPVTYEVPMDIVSFEDVVNEDGQTVPGMTLQWHYTTPYSPCLNNGDAFYVCSTSALAPGTYYITFGESYGKAVAGTSWKFTTTQEVPKGGVLSGFWNLYTQQVSTRKIYTWETPSSDNPIEILGVESTDGSDCTKLCDIGGDDAFCLHRITFGYGNWGVSALRQWLNSNSDTRDWWTSKYDTNLRPDQATESKGITGYTKTKYNCPGFISGFEDRSFIDALSVVEQKTAHNIKDAVIYGQNYYTTKDLFYLASIIQVGGTSSENEDEGSVWQYYIDRLAQDGKTVPFNGTSSNTAPSIAKTRIDSKITAAMYRLRSANRTVGYYTRMIMGAGYISPSASGVEEIQVAPVCTIA